MSVEIAVIKASGNRTIRQRELIELVSHLEKGHFAVLPTDTGPMLACNALDKNAIRHIFELKGRPRGNPIHVAVPDIMSVDRYVKMNLSARRIMELLLPGPLTVICPKCDIISDELVAHTGNLGIRIPDCPTTLTVCASLDKPLTATSLNLSGQSVNGNVSDVLNSLNFTGRHTVYVLEDERQILYNRASTVIRILSEGNLEILREGPYGRADLEAALKTISFEDFSDWG